MQRTPTLNTFNVSQNCSSTAEVVEGENPFTNQSDESMRENKQWIPGCFDMETKEVSSSLGSAKSFEFFALNERSKRSLRTFDGLYTNRMERIDSSISTSWRSDSDYSHKRGNSFSMTHTPPLSAENAHLQDYPVGLPVGYAHKGKKINITYNQISHNILDTSNVKEVKAINKSSCNKIVKMSAIDKWRMLDSAVSLSIIKRSILVGNAHRDITSNYHVHKIDSDEDDKENKHLFKVEMGSNSHDKSSHSLDMTISQIVDGSFFLSIHKDIRRGWSCFHRPCIAMQDSFGNCIGRVKYPLKLCSIEFLVLNHCNEVIYSIHSHISRWKVRPQRRMRFSIYRGRRTARGNVEVGAIVRNSSKSISDYGRCLFNIRFPVKILSTHKALILAAVLFMDRIYFGDSMCSKYGREIGIVSAPPSRTDFEAIHLREENGELITTAR